MNPASWQYWFCEALVMSQLAEFIVSAEQTWFEPQDLAMTQP